MMRSTRTWIAGAAALLVAVAMFAAAFAQDKSRELDYVAHDRPDPARGKDLYATCAACHGASGEGAVDGTVPVVGGQHFLVIARQLVNFRNDSRRDLRMQHFADRDHLASSQQIADVAAYMSSLRPELKRTDLAPEVGARGGSAYARACERCHGPTGEGNENWLVPRIAGQNATYLLRQFEKDAEASRPQMARPHAKVTASTSPADLEAIARYLANITS